MYGKDFVSCLNKKIFSGSWSTTDKLNSGLCVQLHPWVIKFFEDSAQHKHTIGHQTLTRVDLGKEGALEAEAPSPKLHNEQA